MTSLMLDTPLNEEQQDFIETIRGGSDTLLSVINDILDFSKIEAGKLELEEQPFHIRTCVEDTLDLLAEKAAEKMLDMAYILEEGTPHVVIGDITRLRQILVNLLNNAIKFTDKGEIVVNVKSTLVENDQYELIFSVRDTGIGIPANKAEKLFQSFSQIDSSTTRKYGGTGLGLAISKELTEKMGGTMWVESEKGKGSTFYFTILVDTKPDAEPIMTDGIQPQLAGKHILLVDDNATNRLILLRQTKSWGMHPTAVESGAEALTLLEIGEKFDIAILDMQMPEMDGFTLAEKISEMNVENALPMIILTSIKREKARSGDARIAAFLSKPIKTSNLFNILTSIIAVAPAPEKKKKKTDHIDPSMAEKRPLRILLAEDNMINQKVATKLLSRLGYRADVAGNGMEAIEALERQPYDVIFMDIQMPEMDGDEATRQIRAKWPQDQQPHIVAMTAHALEGDREKYIAHGMDDYVSKPIKVDALIAALENVPRVD
jgi:CheY-like chemotaxis protein